MGAERTCLNSIGGFPKKPAKATLGDFPCGRKGIAPKGWCLGQSKVPLSIALADQLHHPKQLKLLPRLPP